MIRGVSKTSDVSSDVLCRPVSDFAAIADEAVISIHTRARFIIVQCQVASRVNTVCVDPVLNPHTATCTSMQLSLPPLHHMLLNKSKMRFVQTSGAVEPAATANNGMGRRWGFEAVPNVPPSQVPSPIVM